MDAPVVSQPDLGQVEGEGTSKLRENVKILEKEFEDLAIATCVHLKKRQVPIHTVRESLGRMSDTSGSIDDSQQHEIQEANTVEGLFEVLSAKQCWDFLHPGLLKRIIDDFFSESSDIQHQKREYLEKLQAFRKTTTLQQFAKVCHMSSLHSKFPDVIFQEGQDWDNVTLESLNQSLQGQEFLNNLLQFKQSKNS